MIFLDLKYRNNLRTTLVESFGDNNLERAQVEITEDVCRVTVHSTQRKEAVTFDAHEMQLSIVNIGTKTVIPFRDASFHAVWQEIMDTDEVFSENQGVGVIWLSDFNEFCLSVAFGFPDGEHCRQYSCLDCKGGRDRVVWTW